mmetsp:Transcript_21146/g.54056  ORF Transcript_21146/g.54056 Transcript_21146/m.54056 type:complete len:255 (-) Transcript_21146:408-1172(-)
MRSSWVLHPESGPLAGELAGKLKSKLGWKLRLAMAMGLHVWAPSKSRSEKAAMEGPPRTMPSTKGPSSYRSVVHMRLAFSTSAGSNLLDSTKLISRARSACQPSFLVSSHTCASHSPRRTRSPSFRPKALGSSLLIRMRLWFFVRLFAMREATGMTCSDVPMQRTILALPKSGPACSRKLAGSCSPKKTISGFTSPEHLQQWTTSSLKRVLRMNSALYTARQSTQCPAPNDPCASMSFSGGMPAARSRPSTFCV